MRNSTRRISPDIWIESKSEATSRDGRRTIDLASDDRPTIGVYHSQAGTRSASGITIYVQEIVDHLAKLNTTYLYTENGSFTGKIGESDAEIVAFQQYTGPRAIYALLSTFSANSRVLSAEVAETAQAFGNTIRDGVIDHINRHVDILLTHNVMDTVLLSNTVDVPVVRVFHGCQRVGIGSKLLRTLSQTATTIANSRQTARAMSERLGCDPDGIVRPGVDIESFSPDRTPAFECDDPAVMFVGRFVREKGVYDLLEAFADVSTDAHLYLIGRGDETKLRRRIEQHGIERSVTIEGPVPHDELPGYYAAADVVCLPSYSESFGMVNLEAMASGTAVITSDLDGIREYATDRETCLLVQPGNVDQLAKNLEELISSPQKREQLGEAGHDVAVTYSWRESAEKLVEICASIERAEYR